MICILTNEPPASNPLLLGQVQSYTVAMRCACACGGGDVLWQICMLREVVMHLVP